MEAVIDQAQVEGQPRYAGFWIRFGAYFIDGILLNILNWVVIFAFGVTDMYADTLMGDPEAMDLSAFAAPYGLIFVLNIVYWAGLTSSSYQATLGKMALGLKVTSVYGERITFINALGRYLSKIISAMILMIGFIMAGFDSKKQGLHDKMANTLVVHK